MRLVLASLALVLLALTPVEAANARKGGELAQTLCARCHSIKLSGFSRHKQAPPFRKIAMKYPVEQLQEALAEGITTGHPDMPEFEFTTNDIEDLLAYLKTLRKK